MNKWRRLHKQSLKRWEGELARQRRVHRAIRGAMAAAAAMVGVARMRAISATHFNGRPINKVAAIANATLAGYKSIAGALAHPFRASIT